MEENGDFNKNIISENSYENKNIQESLPFDNKINSDIKKFILPELEFLRSPTKNEKIAKTNENINEVILCLFLIKISFC